MLKYCLVISILESVSYRFNLPEQLTYCLRREQIKGCL